MSVGGSPLHRLARAAGRHAIAVSPKERADWARAMFCELADLPTGAAAMRWACGCVLVSYTERFRGMARLTSPISRWIMSLEMLICFVPLTFLFGAVLFRVADGSMPRPLGLLYASCGLTGPFGLILGFRMVFARDRAVSRTAIATLAILAGWTLFAASGAVLSNDGLARVSEWWRDFVLLALLPAAAALHIAGNRVSGTSTVA